MPPYHAQGSIQEKHRNGTEISFLWTVPHLFTKNKVGYQKVSPSIKWLGTSWRLLIYPKGREGCEIGWVDISLICSCAPIKPVRMTFGIQKPDRTEHLIYQDHKFGTQGTLYHIAPFIRKIELKRRGSIFMSLNTLTIICIIRVEKSSLVEANLIPSTNLGVKGDIDETLRSPDSLNIEWHIQKLFTLSSQVGDYYSSPDFEFLNTKWRLRLYPFGHPIKRAKGWMGLDVWKLDLSGCKKPVRLALSIKKPAIIIKREFQHVSLAEYRRLWSGHKFVQRKRLHRKMHTDDDTDDEIIISCSFRADEAPSTSRAASDTDAEAVAQPPNMEVDSILENVRSTNEINFEWNITEFSRMSDIGEYHSSPVIEFLNTSWRLKIYPCGRNAAEARGWMAVDVWKLDWTCLHQPVFVTLGIKKVDTTEDVIYRNVTVSEHSRLWRTSKFMPVSELHRRRQHIAPRDVLTITCTLSVQNTAVVPFVVYSSIPKPRRQPDGLLRERECNFHKEVEWDFTINSNKQRSPVFTMGSQTYWMRWVNDGAMNEVWLHSLGSPIGLPDSTLWWVGLKRNDGNFLLTNTCGRLEMVQGAGGWFQRNLYRVRSKDLAEELDVSDVVTVFLRMSVERTPSSREDCSHPIAVMPKKEESYGSVQYLSCPYHQQAEWDVPREIEFLVPARPRTGGKWSPEITCLDEMFLFQWDMKVRKGVDMFVLTAFSKRRSSIGPYLEGRWWAALKRVDGTYELKNMRGELTTQNQCNMWTLRDSLEFTLGEIRGREWNVILKYSAKDAPAEPESCIHGPIEMTLHSAGRMQETKFPLYKQMEWTVDYGLTYNMCVTTVSAAFELCNQRFVLQLKQDSHDSQAVALYLHRMGYPVKNSPRYVRWFAGFRRADGTYYYKNCRGILDLEDDCEIWTQIFLHKVNGEDVASELVARSGHLSIFFRLSEDHALQPLGRQLRHRLSEDRTSHISPDGCNQYLPKTKRKRTDCEDEVTFQVRNRKFKMSRNMLGYRVPVLDAMFQYDTIEKRTGVVKIKDSEPAVFEEFLHYISYGFIRKPAKYNAFDGYVVADKYLLDDLKVESVQFIADNISIHNFCDVFSFTVSFGVEDLLKHLVEFFCKNHKTIMETDNWYKYYKDNPTMAQKILSVMFQPRQKFKANNLYSLFSTKE